MSNKCDCYKTIKRLRYTPFYTKAYYETVGICNGTRERDECSCGGDRTKCDFYSEVRAEAKKKKEVTFEEHMYNYTEAYVKGASEFMKFMYNYYDGAEPVYPSEMEDILLEFLGRIGELKNINK